jgi:heme/copper-type cytochrome/quinol oxidase subunit 3
MSPSMAAHGDRPAPPAERSVILPNGVLAMGMFVIAEVMLFAGLISAFEIVRSSAMVWPPPDQPRLPIAATTFNTLVLLASGGAILLAHRAFHRGDRDAMRRPLFAALGLGSFFVLFQGVEWGRLIAQGLTLQSSTLGSFFYLIVGIHALHAIGALLILARAARHLQRGWLTSSLFGAAEVFWLFVVVVWPVVFGVVYL